MILKGSQRGGARQLAMHLMRTDENDHVELHQLNGFMADDLKGALLEAYAVSKGTRCEQFLFSLSLSPPEKEEIPIAAFERAIADVEIKLALVGQPRVIVFHEKQGRRHAHCVWSRIDADAMKAINLPHFKLKLRDVSRDLYLEHGWHMPAGLANSTERDPRNFTREEWQQAKRAEKDAGEVKTIFQDCWAISDGKKAYVQALEARGLYLARGDRRGFVAIDTKGEIYSIPKWTGLKTKVVEARLGDPAELRSVDETKAYIADLLKGVLGRHLHLVEAEYAARREPLQMRKASMREAQRARRAEFDATQTTRSAAEAVIRAGRFRRGLRGLWDRLTGNYIKRRRENEVEAQLALQRDQLQRQTLVQDQLAKRRQLQTVIRQVDSLYRAEVAIIHREIAELSQPAPTARSDKEDLSKSPRTSRRTHRRDPSP